MKVDLLYTTCLGRGGMRLLQKLRLFRFLSGLMHTRASRLLVPHFIRKHGIDMQPYGEQRYDSFADFFARERPRALPAADPREVISPCDGWMSVYPITASLDIPIKGSRYVPGDLLSREVPEEIFREGLCLVFRLEARDYHHFCCFEDGQLLHTEYIPGQLHSVQPIALRHVPVFRLNRRWCTLLKTDRFGTVAQISIGAMMVGGVSFARRGGRVVRGEELGHFELAGSTIVLLLGASGRERLLFRKEMERALAGEEVPVQMGGAIGFFEGGTEEGAER